MVNELLFLLSICFVTSSTLIALVLGKEALIGLICVQGVLVNLFVAKQITLFGLTATASDSLAVGITLALNLLQEYFKREITQKTIWISFFCALFFSVLSLFQVAFIPSEFDTSHAYFSALLTPMPRLVVASLITYLIVQSLDCRLYAYLTAKFKHAHFILRNYSSAAISQLLDTILFSLLGLYGLNESFSSVSVIFQIIVVCYTVKLLTIFIAAPILSVSKKIVPA